MKFVGRNMKFHRLSGFLLLCLAMVVYLPGCVTTRPETGRVVIIGVDGLYPAGIEAANTPVMDSVCETGACSFEVRSVLPTKSSPNWASLFTGAAPEQHGVTSNRWKREKHSIEPVAVGSEGIFPSLFGLMREQKPDSVIGLSYEWKGFARLVEASVADMNETGRDAEGTTVTAEIFIREQKPDFLFVHLDMVDHAGHKHEWGSAPYIEAVELADALIGRLLQAGREAGIGDTTTWMIAADHGGVGKEHGGESMAELLTPMLISGYKVRPGVRITDPVNVYDIGATTAFLLDIELPAAAIGRPVCGALQSPACGE